MTRPLLLLIWRQTILCRQDKNCREKDADEGFNRKNKRRVRIMIYLSVAYAANTGGTGTLTGTGPNLVLKGMITT